MTQHQTSDSEQEKVPWFQQKQRPLPLTVKPDKRWLEEHACWVAKLGDGTIIYGEDGNPDYSEPIAWKRLKQYLDASQESIEDAWLKFRSNEVPLNPSSHEGFGIVNGIVLFFDTVVQRETLTIVRHNRGEPTCLCTRILIPEMTVFDTSEKPVDKYLEHLIYRNPANG